MGVNAKIAFVTYPNICYPGGGQRIFYILASKLKQLGHTTEILTTDAGPVSTNIKNQLLTEKIQLTELKHISVITLPFGFRKLMDLFKRNDIIYFEYWSGGLEACVYLCSKLSNTPVLTAHQTHLSTAASDRHWLIDMTFRILGPRNIRIGKRIGMQQVVCKQDESEISEWVSRDKIVFLPNGVELSKFSKGEKEAVFTVLFISRLVREKGVHLIPEIVTKLEKRITDFKVVIAGSGPMKPFVEELVKTNEKITYLGEVDGEQKSRIFASSHVLMAPTSSETFMITGIEAMASYTPVIIFDIPGPIDYVRSGYNGFVAKTLDDFVLRISDVHSMWKANRASYESMLNNCRVTAEDYDWDSVLIPRLEKILEKMIY